jgi:hypothetical protein
MVRNDVVLLLSCCCFWFGENCVPEEYWNLADRHTLCYVSDFCATQGYRHAANYEIDPFFLFSFLGLCLWLCHSECGGWFPESKIPSWIRTRAETEEMLHFVIENSGMDLKSNLVCPSEYVGVECARVIRVLQNLEVRAE